MAAWITVDTMSFHVSVHEPPPILGSWRRRARRNPRPSPRTDFARRRWKSLMANTVALVEDAALLASHDGPGRAQALIVLAMEELAKARWLYEAAEHQWTAPLGLYGLEPRPAGDVIVPEGLSSTRRPEQDRIAEADRLLSELGEDDRGAIAHDDDPHAVVRCRPDGAVNAAGSGLERLNHHRGDPPVG
ncbi:AbiV family abortive infection protein [Micromonospora sp. NPDC049048]|uniref:AbiV family abortive infection protein n=1 Tax=Micromonospora sp. NPDC049048 TaxID=3364263 RepID=UPI0037138B8B